ncbi:hypothetical protein BKA70DRAFT_1406792, partial [Coprinopsis sp. MPI-PUGE-AT-0042]
MAKGTFETPFTYIKTVRKAEPFQIKYYDTVLAFGTVSQEIRLILTIPQICEISITATSAIVPTAPRRRVAPSPGRTSWFFASNMLSFDDFLPQDLLDATRKLKTANRAFLMSWRQTGDPFANEEVNKLAESNSIGRQESLYDIGTPVQAAQPSTVGTTAEIAGTNPNKGLSYLPDARTKSRIVKIN